MDLSGLKERIRYAKQRIQGIRSEEEEISDEEERESAEIQKLENLSERVQKSSSKEEILEEEISDFQEAVSLIERISKGLTQTADDLDKTVQEINSTSEQVLDTISQLESGEASIGHRGAEDLKESLNANHQTINGIIQEAQKAKEEAKNLQAEIDSLVKLDKFIENIDQGRHDLSNPERELKEANSRLDNATQRLETVQTEIKEAKSRDKKAFDEISRREVVSRGAATVAALSTLPGVTAAQEANNKGSRSLEDKLREITLRTGEVAKRESGEELKLEEVRGSEEIILELNGQLASAEQGQTIQLQNTEIRVDTIFQGSNTGLAVINVGQVAAETVKTVRGRKKSPEENRSEITIQKDETIEISDSKRLTVIDINRNAALVRITDGNTVEKTTPVSSGETVQLDDQNILVKTIFVGAQSEVVTIQIQ